MSGKREKEKRRIIKTEQEIADANFKGAMDRLGKCVWEIIRDYGLTPTPVKITKTLEGITLTEEGTIIFIQASQSDKDTAEKKLAEMVGIALVKKPVEEEKKLLLTK